MSAFHTVAPAGSHIEDVYKRQVLTAGRRIIWRGFRMKRIPTGMRRFPAGMKGIPTRMRRFPAGMKGIPTRMQRFPVGRKGIPAGMRKSSSCPAWILSEDMGRVTAV